MLSLLAALCMVMVAVWLAMSMYDVFRAVLLPRTRHAEHHLFVEWLSTTCTRPHLRESLICQVAHMDAHGLQPENWLVRQLALIKVRERGIDFCPNESAAQGLTGIVEQHLKNIWVRAGLKMAGLLALDAEATLKKMANGEIGLSRLDDELGALRQRQGERLVKKLLRDPLKAWGIVLADLKPPRLRCGGGGEGEEARTTLRAASVIAAIAALLGGIELMMRDRARQGQGPVTAPARLLDAAAKAVKKAFNAAVQKVATGLVQARAWLLEPESWRARLLNKASQVAAVVAEKGETLLLVIYQRANPGFQAKIDLAACRVIGEASSAAASFWWASRSCSLRPLPGLFRPSKRVSSMLTSTMATTFTTRARAQLMRSSLTGGVIFVFLVPFFLLLLTFLLHKGRDDPRVTDLDRYTAKN